MVGWRVNLKFVDRRSLVERILKFKELWVLVELRVGEVFGKVLGSFLGSVYIILIFVRFERMLYLVSLGFSFLVRFFFLFCCRRLVIFVSFDVFDNWFCLEFFE